MSDENTSANAIKEYDEKEIEGLRKRMEAEGDKLTNRDEDVVGYWVSSKLPIDCIPRTTRLFDSSIDKTKFSALIIVEAVTPTVVEYTKDERVYQKLCAAGDMVGVWYKPGMRGVATTGGVRTIITETGEKRDVGKGNPMTVYSVRADGGALIPITADSRSKSKKAITPFDKVTDETGTAANA